MTLVRSQVTYATEVWSPHTTKLISKEESVQRRATAWILKSKRGEITTLSLLPLCHEREITDLVFFFKALYGNTDLDVRTFVSFLNNGRTRLSQNPTLTLKTPYCKSSAFQASYFNRIVKLWNYVCKILHPTSFASPRPLSKETLISHTNAVLRKNLTCHARGHWCLTARATISKFKYCAVKFLLIES